MVDLSHPGNRLRGFRVRHGLSLRRAAEQLHTAHPVLREWEAGAQVPAPAFRDAIEVWTTGEVKAIDWPLSLREREITEKASQVVAAEPAVKKATASTRRLMNPDADEPVVDSTGTDDSS